jgi:hypothetical protein
VGRRGRPSAIISAQQIAQLFLDGGSLVLPKHLIFLAKQSDSAYPSANLHSLFRLSTGSQASKKLGN